MSDEKTKKTKQMRPLLIEEFPELIQEIPLLLKKENRSDLVPQLPKLRLIDRCHCGCDFCASIYTAPPPKGAWGKGHETIPLDPKEGDLLLDVVNGKIVSLEILSKKKIRLKLNKLLPCKSKVK